MSFPPKYADIGKQIKDLFNKNYNFGNIKCELKSKSPSGSILSVESLSEIESGKLAGFVEFKNVFTGNDMTILNKWMSENILLSELYLENRFQPGTKFGFLTSFDPKSGKIGGAIQAEYKNELMYSKIDAICKDGKQTFVPSCVFNLNGWLCGTQLTLDPSTKKVEKPNFTIGYQSDAFAAFSTLTEKQEIFGTIYQKVNQDTETGIMIQFPYGPNNQTTFEYAMAMQLDKEHKIQAKINTQRQIGLALVKNFGNGIIINLSGNLDGKNIKQGNHKVGFGVQMEA